MKCQYKDMAVAILLSMVIMIAQLAEVSIGSMVDTQPTMVCIIGKNGYHQDILKHGLNGDIEIVAKYIHITLDET